MRALTRVTRKKFPVDQVRDRREQFGEYFYLVRFTGSAEEDSWTPGRTLREDGLGSMCDLVDEWIDDTKRSIQFERYVRGNFTGHRLMTASEEGDCVLNAVRALYEVTGRSGIITTDLWEKFKQLKNIPPGDGLGMQKVAELLHVVGKYHPGIAGEVHRRTLKKNLFRGTKRGTVLTLYELGLRPGQYLVDCYFGAGRRHCMALNITGRFHQVWDEGEWVGLSDVNDYLTGVNGVFQFVFVEDLRHPTKADNCHEAHHQRVEEQNAALLKEFKRSAAKTKKRTR